MAPENLGRYELIDLIGRGGMATVYKARDPVLDRVVAIKAMHAHLAADPAFVGRFRHEAQAVAALRHPNIVRVFDFGNEGDSYFMVMEYIEGTTLASLMGARASAGAAPAEDRPAVPHPGLSTGETLRIFPPLCSALDYATSQGMVHRDIKPANVLLTRDSEPLLTDYGIAKIMGATSYTVPGMVLGSAHYMSPEQVQGLPTDHRTDIYSLGVVLFEALAGRVPYDADTTASILAQHISAPVPHVCSLNPELPPEIDAVLERALAKEPDRRYQRAGDLAAALQSALVPLPGGAAAATVVVGSPSPPPPPPAMAPTVVLGAASPQAAYPVAAPQPPRYDATQARPPAQVPDIGLQPLADQAGLKGRLGKSPLRRWLVVGAVALLAIVVAVVFLVTRSDDTTDGAGDVDAATPGHTTTESISTTTTTLSAQAAELIKEGDTLVQGGKFADGIAKYEEALRENPDSDEARTQLGIVYYLDGRYSTDMVEQQLEMATEKNPSNLQAWTFLGAARFDNNYAHLSVTGDLAPAEEALRTALELDPDHGPAHAFLAELLVGSGRQEAAAAELQKALELAPQDPWVLICAGWINAVQDKWQEAVPYYKQAATYRPNWAYFLNPLAEALAETEKYDEAIGYYRTVVNLDQGYEADGYESIGVTFWHKGDAPGAIANLKKALALDDTLDYSHWAIAAVWYEQEDYSAALPHFQRAVLLEPKVAGYHEWLAWCLYCLDRPQEARVEVDKALELDPSREDSQSLSADLKAEGY